MFLVQLFKRSFKNVLWLVTSLLLIALPFGWLQLKHQQNLQSYVAIVSQHTGFFTCLRWSFILAITLLWSKWVIFYAKKCNWPPEKTQFWLAQRFRVFSWLLLMEIVIGQNIFLKLVQIF